MIGLIISPITTANVGYHVSRHHVNNKISWTYDKHEWQELQFNKYSLFHNKTGGVTTVSILPKLELAWSLRSIMHTFQLSHCVWCSRQINPASYMCYSARSLSYSSSSRRVITWKVSCTLLWRSDVNWWYALPCILPQIHCIELAWITIVHWLRMCGDIIGRFCDFLCSCYGQILNM
jgi:hypothetical protein